MSCDPAIQPKAKLVGAFAGTHIAVVQHTTMRSIMTAMKRSLFALALTLIAAGTAHAQRGHISDGGRMPETMFPGAQPPSSMPQARASEPLQHYPNTESLSHDRIESQGHHVDGMTQQNDGSWQAGASRDAVPTRPAGEEGKATVFPDGRTMEESQ
jgi:hypothetical protein